uniref:Zinc knuckle CX2CX4HX4C domain-containing protein n=1 Tax=Quercus lobata TaxID=97700 RepID=A0A7N2MRR8_QUELO
MVQAFVFMDDPIDPRELGWTESSESGVNDDLFAEEIESYYQSSEDEEVPFARHKTILEADPEELSAQHDFWSSCAIGFILDYRRFSVSHLQHIIDAAWRIRGPVHIVGRNSSFYLLHFESIDDLNHVCKEVNFISVWVQFHGLPLEYQYPELAEKMGQLMGVFERLDWEDNMPRNIRFMRAGVHIDPWLLVVSGFILRMDGGSKIWIQCRYEQIHKLCAKCGLIGHTKGQCTQSVDDIGVMLVRQRFQIQSLYQCNDCWASTATSEGFKKILRKDFGRFDRNIRGFFSKEDISHNHKSNIVTLILKRMIKFRGLGKSSAVLQCQKIALKSKPDILFLMETRLVKDKGSAIWEKCGFAEGRELPREGLSGGLLLAWMP